MSTTLQLGLLLLIFVAMLFLIVIGIYLVKLIIDLNKLANNLNDTTCMVKKEIEPILEELKTSLTNLNSVAKSADDKFNTIRKILTTAFGIGGLFVGGMGKMSGGFFKGLVQGFKTFARK